MRNRYRYFSVSNATYLPHNLKNLSVYVNTMNAIKKENEQLSIIKELFLTHEIVSLDYSCYPKLFIEKFIKSETFFSIYHLFSSKT